MLSLLSVTALAGKVRAGEVKAEEVATELCARIEKLNPTVNAFLETSAEDVIAQARAIDAKRGRGEALGALAGVPIAIKDALCTKGMVSTGGSKILQNYVPPYDATVVRRLREADAIIAGKTNMDEFAMGSSNENSAYGTVKNPWDLTRTPGGSSGGSAAAVAARMTPTALGSDTGGSIRQPASFTGVVGVKPTYGRVSRFGLMAFASSLDQVGPFASDVRGAARVLREISGHDPHDATSLSSPVDDFEAACGTSIRGLRIGVPEEYFAEGLNPEVAEPIRHALAELEREGCILKTIKLPHTKFAVASYYVLATAEASSNLARYDGVRYGLRVEPWNQPGGSKRRDLASMYGATRDAGFGAEVKRRVLLGTFVLSSGYYDAVYLKAQKVRTLIRRDFEAVFSEVDVVCSPVAPTPAFKLGEKTHDPLAMYLSDIYTLPGSLAGVSAMNVPCALTPAGLPVGLQVIAPALREATMFAVASAWEARSPVRTSLPAIAQ